MELLLIFLGGMLCSASIILVLFRKEKVIDRYTIKIVDERKKYERSNKKSKTDNKKAKNM